MTQSFKPKGLPSLLPHLTVKNADQSLAFYRDVCQFSLKNQPEKQNNEIVHAEMMLGDATIMMAPEGAWGSDKKSPKTTGVPSNISLYIYVEDVDAHYEHAKQRGAEILSAPENMFWGDRFYTLRDLDGYEWSFATNVGTHDLSYITHA